MFRDTVYSLPSLSDFLYYSPLLQLIIVTAAPMKNAIKGREGSIAALVVVGIGVLARDLVGEVVSDTVGVTI